MAQRQFLIQNRHHNTWYGRVIVPQSLRFYFSGKRELRRSLSTTDKTHAKRLALDFWVQCQAGFDHLHHTPVMEQPFENARHFLQWLSLRQQPQGCEDVRYIKTTDALGREHVIDMKAGDAKAEIEHAKWIHENTSNLIESLKDDPKTLQALLKIHNEHYPQEAREPQNTASPSYTAPQSPTAFDEAVDLYIDKLNSQGRKGKQLSQRTLLNYQGRLEFWKAHFKSRPVHEISLKELSEIQNWLTRLPVNFSKKGITVFQAVKHAQDMESQHAVISDKTRAEYLGQLKGLLEYAQSCGFITSDMAHHVEIPNTKQTKSVDRLPFTMEDLQKIFPSENYGVDFGIQKSGMDHGVKFWFPLLAAFSGARLEEIAQLKTTDIKTCPDTNIIYMDVMDSGTAADGKKKHAKNKNSVRPIPIHSMLIKIGFLDYVETRKAKTKDQSLFTLKRDKQGRLAKGVSNWFSRMDKRKNGGVTLGYIERRGVLSKGENEAGERWTKSFHSFRHTAIDNLRGKKLSNGEYIREQDIALVMGHEKDKTETASYGADRSQLELRKAVIERL